MLHARNWISDDRTLCGLASEAPDDPATGETEPVEYAAPGQAIACEQCRACIAYCQNHFTAMFRVRD